jgi:hypothetical protein
VPTEQDLNKRSTRHVEYNGELVPVTDLAERLGMHVNTSQSRLQKGQPFDAPVLSAGRRSVIVAGSETTTCVVLKGWRDEGLPIASW